MFLFKDEFSVENPFISVFLCGHKYKSKNPSDKRVILKHFIEKNIENCRALILEQNFTFRNDTKNYLAYDSAFLNSLSQIEELAAAYADGIIIIHETISTAAELGMFAINPMLSKKICIISPDDMSIDENKITFFIDNSFINNDFYETMVGKVIKFYPDIKVNKKSTEISEYYTQFHNDEIGENLGREIIDFISRDRFNKIDCKYKKKAFGKTSGDDTCIDYAINEKDILEINVPINILKIHMLAMFLKEEYRRELRNVKTVKEHINYLYDIYRQLLVNTVSKLGGFTKNEYVGSNIKLKNLDICTLKQSIGYFVFLLQALGYINLERDPASEVDKRKVVISIELDDLKNTIGELIIKHEETIFGRLGI